MELRNRFHLTYCEEYGMWLTLMRACYNPKSLDYKYFGAKGIYPCKDWQTFSGFWHNAYFEGDQTLDRYVLSLKLKDKPHKDCRPKRIGPRSVWLCKISFDKIKENISLRRKAIRYEKRRKIKHERKREEFKKWEEWRSKLKELRPDIYKVAKNLNYRFDFEWLGSFEDLDKLKFLLKYSRKSYNTLSINRKEYYVEFINHFYYDPKFNKIYANWLRKGKFKGLIPSLDHIYPRSKGGSHDLKNLRFVTNVENYLKGTYSLEEWEEIKSNLDEIFI